MANNQMIGKCVNCGQDYCQECSDHKDWELYCSTKCKEEYEASKNKN
jgi:hypothetical protein